MLKDVKREDLEVYMGKWFANEDPETDELRHLLSNSKNLLRMDALVDEGGLTQEYLHELGLKLVYERKRDGGKQKMRWTVVSC